MKSSKRDFFIIVFLILVCLVAFLAFKRIQILTGRAERVPVAVRIDGAAPQIFPKIWQGFAQGGEETQKMIEPVSSAIAALLPSYIRIDHVFDFYNVVSRDQTGQLNYNWTELDERIEEIFEVGALPFISLSYLPPALSSTGSITAAPASYSEWQELIRATIERYSGKNGKNITNLYYEVWNEPDVFGKMTANEYFLLYKYASLGAAGASETNSFRLGGPAILGVNKTWLNDFLGLVAANNLRLDFISWHSYGTNPKKIKLESETIENLENFRTFRNKVEKMVTEWGSDSENSPVHDSYFDAAQTIAAVSESLGAVDRLFAFELKDGLDPNGNQFWGRWGLLTHQTKGAIKKPRYYAFTALNNNLKFFLPTLKDSQSVYGLASTDGNGNYFLTLTAFPFQGGSEKKDIYLRMDNFLPGEFTETISFLGAEGSDPLPETKFYSPGNLWEKNISLNPFNTAFINLKRTSSATTKVPQSATNQNNLVAQVLSPLPPLIYPLFDSSFATQTSGEISFLFRPTWNGTDPNEYFLFETRISPSVKLYAQKRKSEGFANYLDFVFEQGDLKKAVSLDIANWQAGKWYQVSFSWDNPKMEMVIRVDNEEMKETIGVISQISFGKFLYIGSDYEGKRQINADIDNLVVKAGNQVVVNENFD